MHPVPIIGSSSSPRLELAVRKRNLTDGRQSKFPWIACLRAEEKRYSRDTPDRCEKRRHSINSRLLMADGWRE